MTTRNRIKTVLILAAVALMGLSLCASAVEVPAEEAKPAIEMGAPFADNAILQRQVAVPVWVWTKPGVKVTVEFAGQEKKATSDKQGKWILKLKPLKANTNPQEMVITNSVGNKATVENILVGEVWMASGQSNMQWTAGKSSIALPQPGVARGPGSPATQTYNMLISSFNPANFKGVICLTPQSFFAEDEGANFGSEFSVMANNWKASFGGAAPHFFYTIPSKALAPKITQPGQINGKSTACQIGHWLMAERKGWNVVEEDMKPVNKEIMGLIDLVVSKAYE